MSFDDFIAQYDFGLDDYQLDACKALQDGSGVLLAAPTGAGKTVVGEFAVWLAIQEGRKCFYTTPIKALSNQKYHDLIERWGSDRVGLLTGDQVVNSDAQIVVMTTEVLRNMIYASSSTLNNLGYVVLDEVHYLADRFRGAVWEEVILGLAPLVQIVALSATVSNVEEFGDWLAEVRGNISVVVSERRPVPLFQHVMFDRKIFPLFARIKETKQDLKNRPKVNPELLKLSRVEAGIVRDDARRPRGRSSKGKRHHNYGSGSYGGAAHEKFRRKRPATTRRDMIWSLKKAEMLPGICFIFSRQGCDHAVRQVSDIQLTTRSERAELAAIADRQIASFSNADLEVLGYEEFRAALLNGVAAHHAGLLPTFKAIVEESFVSGALKMVFATETLALGINMPARTVVLEKLVKYNGETHADITPGEYTQLTGRAGRRGIDIEGHAVVLWQPGMDPRALAGLASKRTYPLRSSFTPTYNMAVNLVSSQGKDRARELLEQSFAQFQTDKGVVGVSRRVSRLRSELAQASEQIDCHLGDFLSYARIREEISQLESAGSKQRKAVLAAEIADSLTGLMVGDIVWLPKQGWSVVLTIGLPQRRDHKPWVRTLSMDHTILSISTHDLRAPLTAVGRVRVPKKFSLKERKDRRKLINAVAAKVEYLDPPEIAKQVSDDQRAKKIKKLRNQLKKHPSHECPEREQHALEAVRAMRIERELQRLVADTDAKTNSLANSFDRITKLLTQLGYLEGEQVTANGKMLSRVYNELDLVVCEAIQRGIFDGLDAPALAAVLSSTVYESRPVPGGVPARMPERTSEQAQTQLRLIWREIRQLEQEHKIEPGRDLDIGFAEAAWRWASGQELAKVLDLTELSAGDFVRWVRQVIDLAGQIAQALPAGDLRRTCREVVITMRRGVIDYELLDD